MHMAIYAAYALVVGMSRWATCRRRRTRCFAVVVAALGGDAGRAAHRRRAARRAADARTLAAAAERALAGRHGRRCRAGGRRRRGASARGRARGDLPPRAPALRRDQPLRPPERAARRGARGGWLHHLPLARLPVSARGWLRAAALHREAGDLPAARWTGRRCCSTRAPTRPAPSWSRWRCRRAWHDARRLLHRLAAACRAGLRRVPAAGRAGGAGRRRRRSALLLGAAADDPAGPRFALVPGAPRPLPLGEAALTGVLTLAPYPVLHLPPDAAAPRGRAVLLADDGKRGRRIDPALDGRTVAAEGFALARGDIDMLVLAAPAAAGRGRAAGASPPSRSAAGASPARSATANAPPAACARAPGSAIAPARCCASMAICRPSSSPPRRSRATPSCCWARRTARACRRACATEVGLRVTLEGAVERRGGHAGLPCRSGARAMIRARAAHDADAGAVLAGLDRGRLAAGGPGADGIRRCSGAPCWSSSCSVSRRPRWQRLRPPEGENHG